MRSTTTPRPPMDCSPVPERSDYFDFIHFCLCFLRQQRPDADDPLAPPPNAAAPGHRAPRRQGLVDIGAITCPRCAPRQIAPSPALFHFQSKIWFFTHNLAFVICSCTLSTRTHLSIVPPPQVGDGTTVVILAGGFLRGTAVRGDSCALLYQWILPPDDAPRHRQGRGSPSP
jgi:hypothetical protein